MHELEKQLGIVKNDTVEALEGVSFLLEVHKSGKNDAASKKSRYRTSAPGFNHFKGLDKDSDESIRDSSTASSNQVYQSKTVDCDKYAITCSMCMTRMGGIESRLVNALLRLSKLEETKSGTIVEGAIMVKDELLAPPPLLYVSLQRRQVPFLCYFILFNTRWYPSPRRSSHAMHHHFLWHRVCSPAKFG